MSSRPPLPDAHTNPFLPSLLASASLPPVKYQILNCQGQDILVGRLKIVTNTTSGHAFILRRFDTGAVSVTTMFRAAFPNASDQEERAEIGWIKEHYDLSGNNGTMRDQHIARLAGVWVSPTVALELGSEYRLGALMNVVVDAVPDPAQNYRRSGNAAGRGVTGSPQVAPQVAPPVTAPAQTEPSAPKRRRESSPAPVSTQVAQPPRRSTRTRSPAPRSTVQQLSAVVVPRTPRAFRTAAVVAARREEVASGGSEDTVVEQEETRGDAQKVVEHVAGDELREQDVTEQKALIQKLKAQREAQREAQKETKRAEESEREDEEEGDEESMNGKRAREEEQVPMEFNFREPESEERQIATNNRIEKWRLNPGTKRVAWGVAAFAAGLGAVLLPGFL